ncbi:hypothetical protein JYT20_01055 [Rhodothermus sp. AH-315-K08]|nr:hypothetical protein [Rhodothermus sp. AH-315-K08]
MTSRLKRYRSTAKEHKEDILQLDLHTRINECVKRIQDLDRIWDAHRKELVRENPGADLEEYDDIFHRDPILRDIRLDQEFLRSVLAQSDRESHPLLGEIQLKAKHIAGWQMYETRRDRDDSISLSLWVFLQVGKERYIVDTHCRIESETRRYCLAWAIFDHFDEGGPIGRPSASRGSRLAIGRTAFNEIEDVLNSLNLWEIQPDKDPGWWTS